GEGGPYPPAPPPPQPGCPPVPASDRPSPPAATPAPPAALSRQLSSDAQHSRPVSARVVSSEVGQTQRLVFESGDANWWTYYYYAIIKQKLEIMRFGQ